MKVELLIPETYRLVNHKPSPAHPDLSKTQLRAFCVANNKYKIDFNHSLSEILTQHKEHGFDSILFQDLKNGVSCGRLKMEVDVSDANVLHFVDTQTKDTFKLIFGS